MDGVFPDKNRSHSDHTKENSNTFLTEMNDLKDHNLSHPEKQVLVFGATNYPDQMENAAWSVKAICLLRLD